MKTAVAICLLCAMLFGCADSSINRDETTAGETEVYSPNNKSYSGGFFNFISKKETNNKPLIKEGALCGIDEIEFIPDYIEDERFISTEEYYSDVGETGQRMPSGNYLTYPDGTKEKICTDKYCRTHPEEYCTHINLSGGIVDGRYVYYIGKFKNEDKEKSDGTFTSLDYSNYLMRYDLDTNENETIIELPYYASIAFSAFGCLYINIDVLAKGAESLNSRNQYTIIYDKKNIRAAEVRFVCLGMYNACTMDDWIYYLSGGLYRVKYDLSENELIDNSSGEYTYAYSLSSLDPPPIGMGADILGMTKNKVFCRRFVWSSGKYEVISVDENGKIRSVISDVDGAILSDGYLYCVEDRHVMRYRLEFRGRIADDGESLFSEAENCRPGEHISDIQPYGDGAVVYTENKSENLCRKFLITETDIVLDGEGKLSE